MEKLLFTVFDSAAGVFMSTFEARTIEEASRMFRVTVNNPESQLHKFPEDYTLFCVGEFSIETGLIKAYETPKSLGLALSYLEKPNA